jgi:hypothetical protein
MVRAPLREELQGFLAEGSNPYPSIGGNPMTIDRLDAFLLLEPRKASPELSLLRMVSVRGHESFLIGMNVLSQTSPGQPMSRVLRIFRMNPIKLVDEPERFVNRHGRLYRLSRYHELSHLVRGSQRKNGSAQLLIIFIASCRFAPICEARFCVRPRKTG